MGEVWTLFVLDPVLDYRLTLAEDSISVGISKNIHELTRVCSGQSHSHSRFELHAILEDKLRVDVENFTHIVRAGQAILIPPGQHHRTMQETAGFCRVTVGITVTPGSLYNALVEKTMPCRMLDMGPEMTGLLRNVLEESEAERPFHEDLIRLWLAQIVILLLRQLGVMERQLPPPDKDRDRTLDIIDNYFEFSLAANPRAEELAEKLHISRRHLSRILQRTYGMNFRDKLLLARMDRSAWLLRHTDKSVSAIAGEVGYTYDSAFRQAFGRQFAMTPMEYRQKNKKG